jgi:2',3'-cyclic-nucleotide 2'-phosphodiesterase (5'-nucleotidase family)
VNIFTPAFSRRRFLRTLAQGAFLATFPRQILAEEAHAVTISILHTTDLHGHILPTIDYDGHPDLGGLARCATQIRQWRQANPNSLFIDIGDIYQGTEVGLQTRGATMIRGLNSLACDAWVVGNHEFDWGMEPFTESLRLSAMPVLSGNALIEGKAIGSLNDSTNPLSRLKPWLLKEISGFRILIIGLTTPALSTWLPPENLTGFESLDPIESLHKLLREAGTLKPDAIVLAGHMGLIRRDDYANQVGALTREFPQLTVYIGGHTHQNHSGETVHNVLYTQADHYGIYAGKVDLTFDPTTRQLLKRKATTVHMDNSVALDPQILSLAHADLDAADLVLSRPIGTLTEPFSLTSAHGQPSDIARLIGSSMRAALRQKGCETDVIIHGTFDTTQPFDVGPKTVADAWNILPYENQIVTVDLTREDLLAIMNEFLQGTDPRGIMGVRINVSPDTKTVSSISSPDGAPLPGKATYRVALNSYDAQSAGQRFPVTGRLVARPANHRVLHSIEIRDALIDFFVTRKNVGRDSLLV